MWRRSEPASRDKARDDGAQPQSGRCLYFSRFPAPPATRTISAGCVRGSSSMSYARTPAAHDDRRIAEFYAKFGHGSDTKSIREARADILRRLTCGEWVTDEVLSHRKHDTTRARLAFDERGQLIQRLSSCPDHGSVPAREWQFVSRVRAGMRRRRVRCRRWCGRRRVGCGCAPVLWALRGRRTG